MINMIGTAVQFCVLSLHKWKSLNSGHKLDGGTYSYIGLQSRIAVIKSVFYLQLERNKNGNKLWFGLLIY